MNKTERFEKESNYSKGIFADRLYAERTKRGLMQSQLADAVQLSTNALSNYEGKNREPSLDAVYALADFFAIPIDSLVGRDAYTAGKLETADDAAKILSVLEKKEILKAEVVDGKVRYVLNNESVGIALMELNEYLLNKGRDSENVKEPRFDEWYEHVYEGKGSATEIRYATANLDYKHMAFPQNILAAIFDGQFYPEFDMIDPDKLCEELGAVLKTWYKPDRAELVYNIIMMRYRDKKTLGEVSSVTKYSREYIRQIEKKHLPRFRGLACLSEVVREYDLDISY